MGLVSEVFNEARLKDLKGHIAIGHVRYSTTGSSVLQNAQPFCVYHAGRTLAVAHDGNLVNARYIRKELERHGSIFQTTMDSEIIIHLLAKARKRGLEEAIGTAMRLIKGAYSVVMATEKKLIGFRDPLGFRPLCIGKLSGGYVLASETCALGLIEALATGRPANDTSSDGGAALTLELLADPLLERFESLYLDRHDCPAELGHVEPRG